MRLARVIGTIWATRKESGTEGLKMQLVQPLTGEGKPVRRAAVRCLERDRMLEALTRTEAWQPKIESLANGPDAEIAASAGRILDAIQRKNRPEEERADRGRAGPRGSRRPVSRPASPVR